MTLRLARSAAIPLLFLLATSLGGLDFGTYWDDEAMFTKVRRALSPPPTLLPYAYDYPSTTFWMTLASLAPEAIGDARLRYRVPDTSSLLAATETSGFRLRVRTVFAVLSALTIVWVAGLSLALGATELEACLGCAFAATSWELTYHIRWIAPDGAMTMFGTLALFAIGMAGRSEARASDRWLVVAAAAVGLATGSKYSAWPLVLPLLMAAWPRHGVRAFAFPAAAVLAYLATTPGTLLQPTLFVGGARGQIAHYATGHGIYTIARGATHLARMIEYVGLVLMSPYAAVALAMTVASVIGAVDMWRRTRREAFLVLAFPLFYIAYLSVQRVMIVRNLMIVVPFVAVCAARGFRSVWDRTDGRRASIIRSAIVAAAAFMIALNAFFNVRSVESIRDRSAGRTLDAFARWHRTQPAGRVALSPRLRTALGGAAEAAGNGEQASQTTAFYALEPPHLKLRANERRQFAEVFGPSEVNLNYYPDWVGDEHIVVVPTPLLSGPDVELNR